MAQDSTNKRLVAGRFDGERAWNTLTRDEQDVIGAAALELLVGLDMEIHGRKCGDARWPRLGNAAIIAAHDAMSSTARAALPVGAFLAPDGSPLVPSLLGMFCAACGCTQNDPCTDGCGWASDDLCTACAEVAAALRLLPLLSGRVP